MQKLYVAANLVEAQLLLHRLSAAGIRCSLLNEHFDRLYGEVLEFARPQLWVWNATDLTAARQVVDEWLALPVNVGVEWICNCGAANPPGFELCWECGETHSGLTEG